MQESQKAIIEATKETRESKQFNAIKKAIKKNHDTQNAKGSREMSHNKCKCCGTTHKLKWCPVSAKNYTGYSRTNHFEWLCRSMSKRLTRNAVREKHWDVYNMCKDAEETEVSTEELHVIRSNVFNYHRL